MKKKSKQKSPCAVTTASRRGPRTHRPIPIWKLIAVSVLQNAIIPICFYIYIIPNKTVLPATDTHTGATGDIDSPHQYRQKRFKTELPEPNLSL